MYSHAGPNIAFKYQTNSLRSNPMRVVVAGCCRYLSDSRSFPVIRSVRKSSQKWRLKLANSCNSFCSCSEWLLSSIRINFDVYFRVARKKYTICRAYSLIFLSIDTIFAVQRLAENDADEKNHSKKEADNKIIRVVKAQRIKASRIVFANQIEHALLLSHFHHNELMLVICSGKQVFACHTYTASARTHSIFNYIVSNYIYKDYD